MSDERVALAVDLLLETMLRDPELESVFISPTETHAVVFGTKNGAASQISEIPKLVYQKALLNLRVRAHMKPNELAGEIPILACKRRRVAQADFSSGCIWDRGLVGAVIRAADG